jgi:hypothetical protein
MTPAPSWRGERLDLDEKKRNLLALGPTAVLAGGLASCSVKDNSSPTGNSSSGGGSVSGNITFLTFETPNLSAAYWDATIKRVTDKYPGRSIGQYQVDLDGVLAIMFLATLPVLIFYLALQKQFVKGLTGGATKG